MTQYDEQILDNIFSKRKITSLLFKDDTCDHVEADYRVYLCQLILTEKVERILISAVGHRIVLHVQQNNQFISKDICAHSP